MSAKTKKICDNCQEPILKGHEFNLVTLFDDPWGEGKEVLVHADCYDLLFDENYADFRYFVCDGCGRTVISQCPSNGWHSYKHIIDGEYVCSKCVEDDILTNGISRSKFNNVIPDTIFFDEDTLTEKGFTPVPSFQRMPIRTTEHATKFCDKAKELIDGNNIVVVSYDSLAIGGLEGYVSLYSKPSFITPQALSESSKAGE